MSKTACCPACENGVIAAPDRTCPTCGAAIPETAPQPIPLHSVHAAISGLRHSPRCALHEPESAIVLTGPGKSNPASEDTRGRVADCDAAPPQTPREAAAESPPDPSGTTSVMKTFNFRRSVFPTTIVYLDQESVRCQQHPFLSSRVVATWRMGDVFHLLDAGCDQNSDWARVRTCGGEEGFVPSETRMVRPVRVVFTADTDLHEAPAATSAVKANLKAREIALRLDTVKQADSEWTRVMTSRGLVGFVPGTAGMGPATRNRFRGERLVVWTIAALAFGPLILPLVEALLGEPVTIHAFEALIGSEVGFGLALVARFLGAVAGIVGTFFLVWWVYIAGSVFTRALLFDLIFMLVPSLRQQSDTLWELIPIDSAVPPLRSRVRREALYFLFLAAAAAFCLTLAVLLARSMPGNQPRAR